MKINFPEIGVCGLSCGLCPMYQSTATSRCKGCKSKERIALGCPLITCAVKRNGIEFCWQCDKSKTCPKLGKKRQASKKHDSFKCYQKLENDISFIQQKGISPFVTTQKQREKLLRYMLNEYNEGHSKSYYCIAATVLEIDELKESLTEADRISKGFDIRSKAKTLHALLDAIARRNGYILKLRK
jgi:hypothetical protein